MDALQQIRDKGLKVTTSRLNVMNVLRSSAMAYSHSELESLFHKIDRVTLYRILNDFEEAGLVHKILDAQGVTRFALCHHDCPDEHHTDEHVHFNCNSCHKVFCLDHVHMPKLKMPGGFKVSGLQTLIFGLCNHCNTA